jgi:UDP-N-acetylmuramate--alanine ligase
MSPLAEAFFRLGYSVSGYDRGESDYLKSLTALGISVTKDANYDFGSPSAVIISSAISGDHPQLIQARSKKINVLHRSELLAELVNHRFSIAVAGTHGKTSTTGLIAHMLHQVGKKPLALVGGILNNYGSSVIFGDGPCVVEADESDGSFLKYHSDTAVITNIEPDHMDYWKSEENLASGFRRFIEQQKKDVPTVVGWDSPILRNICQSLDHDFIAYGFSLGCHVRAFDIRPSDTGSEFTALIQKEAVKVKISLPGKHNVLNALAALSLAEALRLPLIACAESLQSFTGVARRFELIEKTPSRVVFNDYAHNPGKIRAACSVLTEYFPYHRKIVVFQPHRYSRVSSLFDGFAEAFLGMNRVYVTPVYASGESPLVGSDSATLARAIEERSQVKTIAIHSMNDVSSELMHSSSQKDVILFLGAGDIQKYIHEFVQVKSN